MTQSFNDNSADKQRLERAMMGVAQQLAAMAPNPDCKTSGPCFVKQDPRIKTGSDNDGLLGGMVLESLCGFGLGSVFAEAVNLPEPMQQIDWGDTVDIYDEYISDRTKPTFTLGQKNSLNGAFNDRATLAEKAFRRSLPERMKLEQTYAHLSRELDQHEKPSGLTSSYSPAPAIAA